MIVSEKYHILVVEDDAELLNIITLYLQGNHCEVFPAVNGLEAQRIMTKKKIDLVISDIMMPCMDGYDLTQWIRKNSNIPIILLSSKDASSDKILGLNLGADDYITKPFSPIELLARVNSNLRRYHELGAVPENPSECHSVQAGGLYLNFDEFLCTKNGVPVDLTPAEYKILGKLMMSPRKVFTKKQLYENIYGSYINSDERTMKVHISKLREKIEDDSKNPKYIKTIKGIGYKFDTM